MNRFERPDPATGKGLIAGLVGGVAGSLAMAAFQLAASRTFVPAIRPAEHDVAGDASADGGTPSTVRGAKALARVVGGFEVPRRYEAHAGHAFHFAFGTGLGAAYGMLVEHLRIASAGSGLPFGAFQVILADELSVPSLGLSGSPSKAPISAHLGSLAAHMVYGLVTERVRRRVRAAL